MQSYSVRTGVNMTQLVDQTPRRRLTKALVKRIVADHPEWDWRIIGGPYVSTDGAIANGLMLEVRDDRMNLVAAIYTDGSKATVR